MKATLFLRKDHEKVHSLFDRFQRAKGSSQNGKRGIFDEIRKELSVHSHIEMEIFYPELKQSTSKHAVELVDSATADHQRIEKLLGEIASATGNEKMFETKMNQLIESVQAHITQEEEEIFPEARHALSEQRLEELGLEMEDRKRILTQAAA